MIVGLGVDMAQIERFEKLIDNYGARAAQKILAPIELQRFNESVRPAALLAKRWAVKEAFGKALGTGVGQGITLPEIAVVPGEHGAPELQLSGKAALMVQRMGVEHTHLSISDEAGFAIALVILEK